LTRPSRYLVRMFVFMTAVLGLAAVLAEPLYRYFMGNWLVNGVIIFILVVGTVYIFRQVILLYPEIGWIERFRRNQNNVSSEDMPRLLSPLATMLADRRGGKMTLSALSMRTLLDGIQTRLDETRESSDYLRGLLLFLGLLGTFYGLLQTVSSVPAVVQGLSVGTNDAARAFSDFKAGLMPILSGMGTAFSASLFGLAGSLVIGFLGLQATLAQNLFYNGLEEWLSGYTRLGGGLVGEGGETSVPAFIQALLEQTADSLENLQRIMTRGEESRVAANANTLALTERLTTLADQMRIGQNLLLKLAEQQGELKPVLARLAESAGGAGQDETRTHLRNIEVYLARLAEDLPQGRGEAVQEIRNEIRLLARTIAALAQEPQRP
jgi:hypothetical protein